MKRRLLSSLLVAMTLAVSVPAPVYAADTSSDSTVETEDSTEGEEKKPWYSEAWDWITGGSDEEEGEKLEKTSDKSKRVQTMSDIAAILKKAKMGNKKQIAVKAQVVADIIVTLRGFGLSDSAILGVLVNIMHESQFNPYIIQGQTTTEAMSAFDMNTGYLKINGKNYNDTVENVTARYAERDYTVDYTKQTAFNMGIGLCQWTESRKLQLLAVGNHTRSDRKTCIWNLSGTNTNWAISAESLGEFRSWSQYQPDTNTGRNFSITHLTVPSAPLQMAFLVKGISNGEDGAEQSATGGSGENSFLGGLESEDVAKWSVQGGIGDSGWMDNIEVYVEKHPDLAFQYGGAEEMTFEEFCSLDDPLKAAEAFAAHFERCGDEKRYKSIEKDCELLAPLLDMDTEGLLEASASYSNTEDVAGIITSMVSTGYLTEDDLSSFSKGAELNVDAQLLTNAIRESLNQDEIYNLANWERNVEYDQTDSKLIVLGRRILIALGVIFEVWGMLIYLAYWFDRLNNFIPIDLLNILTLGKLRIADSDTEVTFSLRDNSTRSRVKTVNHRAVLFIAITAIAFGTLIVTGTLFRILFGVVAFVRKLLK